MGKRNQGVRDGTGPFSGGTGRRRRAGAICPFDEESVEDIEDMDIKLDTKRKIKIVSDEIGQGSRLIPSTFQRSERRFIK